MKDRKQYDWLQVSAFTELEPEPERCHGRRGCTRKPTHSDGNGQLVCARHSQDRRQRAGQRDGRD